jgi:hypothetical protein
MLRRSGARMGVGEGRGGEGRGGRDTSDEEGLVTDLRDEDEGKGLDEARWEQLSEASKRATSTSSALGGENRE